MKHQTRSLHYDTPSIEHPCELFTVAEVAARLRVDPTTVRRWIRQGSLPAVRLPGGTRWTGYRIPATTLHALLGGADTPSQEGGTDHAR